MPPGESATYDLWDWETLGLPPRSHFYPLKPIGLGTVWVESLTSYIARLAQEHTTLPTTLVNKEIVPCLGTTRLQAASLRLLNGAYPYSLAFVKVLEQLTANENLRSLTMLRWINVVDPKRIVHATRRWCASCYDEWRGSRQVVYDPLLWNLRVTTHCPRHKTPLSAACGQCGKTSPTLTQKSRPGHCPRCRRWLGLAANALRSNGHWPSENERLWQEWMAHSLRELLTVAPDCPAPTQKNLTDAIHVLITQGAGGSMYAIANELQFSSAMAINTWRQGKALPSLEMLLRLGYAFGLTPLRLLTETLPTAELSWAHLPQRRAL